LRRVLLSGALPRKPQFGALGQPFGAMTSSSLILF
jgi:hypothetical protein